MSVHTAKGNLVSWRHLADDAEDLAFDVYRGTAKVNSAPVEGATNFFDSGAPADADYTVRPW
ncbi:hypothetical protein NKH77_02195 [Streptomyces sp. M19]